MLGSELQAVQDEHRLTYISEASIAEAVNPDSSTTTRLQVSGMDISGLWLLFNGSEFPELTVYRPVHL